MYMNNFYGFKDGKEIYFSENKTLEEISEELKNNSLEYLYFNEDENDSGITFERIWFDPETEEFVWEEGSQARASDGGLCWSSAIYELGRNSDFTKLLEG